MIMKEKIVLGKILVILIVGAAMVVTNSIIVAVIQPEVSTSLALEQFADPSVATDSASRLIDRLYPMILNCVIGVYSIASVLWLRKDLVNLFKKVAKNEEL